MSNTEIIKMLSEIRDYLTAGNPIWDTDKVREAMNVAISAVEAKEDREVGKLCYKNKNCLIIVASFSNERTAEQYEDYMRTLLDGLVEEQEHE